MEFSWVGGAAILGAVAMGWQKLKAAFSSIYGLVVVKVELQREGLVDAMTQLIFEEFRCSALGKRTYRGDVEYVRSQAKNELIAFELLPREPTVFWRGWRPMTVSRSNWHPYLSVSFIRGTFDREKLILEATERHNAKMDRDGAHTRYYIRWFHGTLGESHDMSILSLLAVQGSGDKDNGVVDDEYSHEGFYSRRPIGHKLDDIGQPITEDPFRDFVLEGDAVEAVEEAKSWRYGKEWYKQRMLPWRRGWGIIGPTGTGKTHFIRALAQLLDMPLMLFDLASMNNKDFMEAWGQALKEAPCFVVCDDFDTNFEGRKNVGCGELNGLTFGCLLNVISGAQNSDGIFFVLTTNHPEKVDPALLGDAGEGVTTRPGRIDRLVRMGPLSREGKRRIAERIFVGQEPEEWEHLITDRELTGAQFQDICSQAARHAKGEGDGV